MAEVKNISIGVARVPQVHRSPELPGSFLNLVFKTVVFSAGRSQGV